MGHYDKLDGETFEKLRLLQAIFFDFDGVFTDNRVIVSENGQESVICNRSDGIGLRMLRSLGLEMMIISTETNRVVSERAQKLKVSCIHGCENKLETMNTILAEKGIAAEHAAFVGNDINDSDCLKNVGVSVCVQDAFPEIKQISTIILQKNGGEAAVREFCELVHNSKTGKL